MNFPVKQILTPVLTLLLVAVVWGQELGPSQYMAVLNSKRYYVHTLKKNETLLKLSILYGVPGQEIALHNRNMMTGLKKGYKLKIPMYEEKGVQEGYVRMFYHKVRKKQTIYSLSKLYHTPVDEILKFNIVNSGKLKVGQTLIIPFSLKQMILAEDDMFYYHILNKNDTWKSLEENYQINKNSIKKANHQKNDELLVGSTLKIPKGEYAELYRHYINMVNKNRILSHSDSMLYLNSTMICDTIDYDSNPVAFKIALLIPFYLNDNQNIISTNSEDTKFDFYKNTTKLLEFYEGALIALDSMRRMGLNARFYVYDTDRDEKAIPDILTKPEMKEMDMIIGPAYSSNTKLVADFGLQNNVPVITPFGQNPDLLDNHANLIQIKSTNEAIIEKNSKFFATTENANIIIYQGSEDAVEKHQVDLYENYLKICFEERGKVLNFTRVTTSSEVVTKLTKSQENFVIMVSDVESTVASVISKLNQHSKTHKISLFGMQSWDRFKSVELEYLQNLNFHYNTSSFTDFDDVKIKEFRYLYRSLYKSEPTNYSYSGFDVTYYLLNKLKKHGKSFAYCLPTQPEFNGLQNSFNFRKKTETGGFENKASFIVKYNLDYTILKVYW